MSRHPGNGTSATARLPVHRTRNTLYVSEGVYTVTLKVRNNFGEDTKVRSNLIEVNKGPVVDFIADMTTVGVGRRVTFTDLSSNYPDQMGLGLWRREHGDGCTTRPCLPYHRRVRCNPHCIEPRYDQQQDQEPVYHGPEHPAC